LYEHTIGISSPAFPMNN